MNEPITLKRALSLPQIVFYGLGTILGAGIYVLIGAVATEAGRHVPLAFIGAALIAGLTALVYAEMSSRMPVSAAEAMFIDSAFGRRPLTLLVGLAVVLTSIVSSATIANGFAGYLATFAPVPPAPAIALLVLTLGAIAAIGIEASVWAATTITLVEIGGLLLVVAVAGDNVFSGASITALTPPGDFAGMAGIATGAVLAFYAFIGFEDMVNVAEEVHDAPRNLPRAIVIALIVSTLLYVLVALTAVTAVPLADLAGSTAPLAVIVAAHGLDPRVIAAVSLLAVVNGALIQIIMGTRILYGLARDGRLARVLAQVHPRTRTPLPATATVTALVLFFALWLPLVRLAALTSVIILLVFAAVNAALIALRLRGGGAEPAFRVPLWVPFAGCGLSLTLVACEWLL
ncbi:MAG: APC family permease [Gammaproteobacteria bacterium]